MKKTIIYQMLPRLWGEGKMSSVDTETLDYLKKLGISHVWYTGIVEHSTGKDFVKGDLGSPYAICDYYDVNPYLADVPEKRVEEFEDLVKRTHEHGLKVIIDFVPNHVGKDYEDAHGGIPHFDYCDYDWTDTLKINYSAPETYGRMKDIVMYWASKGVDGFRCDMVEMVPPEFMKWLIREVKSHYKELIFIAEVYQKEKYWMYIKEVGFDYLYDKSGLYDVLRGISAGYGTAKAITWNWQFLQDLQPNMLNFLENHDEQRIASPWFRGTSQNDAYLYTSLALNTAPFMIYFGQEVGADAAEGHEGRTSIFSRCNPKQISDLNSYVHGKGRLSLEEAACLKRYKAAFALAGKDAIGSGLTYDLCYCQEDGNGFDFGRNFAFIRHSISKTKMLKHRTFLLLTDFCENGTNFGTNTTKEMTIKIPEDAVRYLGLDLDLKVLEEGLKIEVENGGCTVVEL